MGNEILHSGNLYILSGPSAAGKSTFLKNLSGVSPDMIVSSDQIRMDLLGTKDFVSASGEVKKTLYGWDIGQGAVWSIVQEKIQLRSMEHLTTFVDSTALTQADRNSLAKVAQDFGLGVKVVFFDAPEQELYARDSARALSVGAHTIKDQLKIFDKDGKLASMLYDPTKNYAISPPGFAWGEGKFDVIGDTHGLLKQLKLFVEELGYVHNASGVPEHPDGRKLIFLGDFIDRGPESIQMLRYVEQAVQNGRHKALIGNHEQKLVKHYRSFKAGKSAAGEIKGLAPSITFSEFLKIDEGEQTKLVGFLQRLPHYLTTTTPSGVPIALVHSDIVAFNENNFPLSAAIYGTSGRERPVDSDKMYHEGFVKGLHSHYLIRGHIPQTSVRPSVISLDRNQAFGGELVGLPLDLANSLGLFNVSKQLNATPEELAKLHQESTRKFTTGYNFDDVAKDQFALMNGFLGLQKRKLASVKLDDEFGMTIWKYTKQVFFDHLWAKDPLISKARGLVLDMGGNIVQHPFDKVFNYLEEGAGSTLKDDHKVVYVEKLNGFLGVVGAHPYKPGKVLCTTTGSFNSPFVSMIREFIEPSQEAKISSYCKREGITLMFEVLHKDDPHIIPYKAEDHGLWLIGARSIHDKNSALYLEEELDKVADTLGLRRPKYAQMDFKAALETAKAAQDEGAMIRDLVSGEVLVKCKSLFYLTTKFLGRMGLANQKFMFKQPEAFKKNVDEEFFPIVDALVSKYTQEQFAQLGEEAKVSAVRDIIEKQRASKQLNVKL